MANVPQFARLLKNSQYLIKLYLVGEPDADAVLKQIRTALTRDLPNPGSDCGLNGLVVVADGKLLYMMYWTCKIRKDPYEAWYRVEAEGLLMLDTRAPAAHETAVKAHEINAWDRLVLQPGKRVTDEWGNAIYSP